MPSNVLILGELTGADGTRYRVALRWAHSYDPGGDRGPALDAVLPLPR